MESLSNPGRRMLRLYLPLFVFLLITIFGSRVIAGVKNIENPSKTTSVSERISTGSYCGVYCLYSAMKLLNCEVNFSELVKPGYIGSRDGSSLSELKKASEDHGLYAIPVGKLSTRDLCQLEYPIILHVKMSAMSKTYNHYELFLGTENNQAKLFDPPNPITLISFAQLAPHWDGNGLIVSTEPIDVGAIFAPARKCFVLYATAVVIAILVLHRARTCLPQELLNTKARLFALSVTQAGAFAVVALLCGILYHFANDEGLLANANATTSIEEAHTGNFIPKVSERKVQKLFGSGAVFIDARFPRDYEQGHLEGAISVPIDANDVERHKATAHISKDASIVLYCQSAGCKFAETVAVKLMEDGFFNISIFQGGWQEWVTKNGKPKEAAL